MGTSQDNAGIASLVEKSNSNWALSEQLRNQEKYDAAANRLYYSLFQAVKAYAVMIGKADVDEDTGVHGKMKRIVSEEDRSDGEVFGDAMDLRVKADYLPAPVTVADFDQTFVFNAEHLRCSFIRKASGKVSA